MGVIFSILKNVPLWAWALSGLLAWGGWQKHRADAGATRMQAAIVQASQQREQKLQEDLKESSRRITAQTEIANEATQAASAINSRADSNAVRVRGLRDQLSALRAQLATTNPPAAAASAADAAADLFGQCAERYSSVAAEADRAIVAGQACQRAYDSLKGPEHDVR